MASKLKTPIVKTFKGAVTNPLFFSVLYLITSVIWYFPSFGPFLDYPMKLLFLWGVALIIYDFFTKRRSFSGYKSVLLVLLTISYAITVLMNTDRLYSGIKHLVYNSILIFIVYAIDTARTKEYYKKAFIILNDLLIGITLVASVISIVMFALRYSQDFERGDMTFSLGIVYNRLHGVYTSANVGALFSVVSITLSLITYHLNIEHFKKFKGYYIVNAIIQLLYYSATLSKGGFLAIMVFTTTLVFVYGLPVLIKKLKPIVAILLSLLIATVACFIVQGATVVSRYTMLSLPKMVNLITSGGSFGEEDPLTLERVETDGDMTNGRTTIWAAGLALMKENITFGSAEADVYNGDTLVYDVDESKLSQLNIDELKRAGGYMHNALIQIVVYSGIAGLLLFLIFAFFVGKKYLISLLKTHKTKYYGLIASVFVLIMVFVSQIPAEAHILFNRQDPFAIIFWLYLGYGIYLIKDFEKHESEKSLFICDTPYQIINSLSLSSKEKNPDIYIYNQFKSAENITAQLKKAGIFENVVLVNRYRSYPGVLNKIVTLYRIITPWRTLKKYSVDKIDKIVYKKIYTSFFTQFTDSLKLLNPYASVVQYEDGIGSYSVNDFQVTCRSGLFKFVNKLLLGKRLTYNIDTLYLNNPKCYDGDAYEKIKELPKLTVDKKIEEIFSYEYNDLYKNSNCIYLTQPLDQTAIGKRASQVEREILKGINKKVTIRIHPRQNHDEYADYNIDNINNLWEIECAKQIENHHMLIGAFSTAQFIPKMLFDTEPTVIFTYKIYGIELQGAKETIEKLKNMYSDSKKVIVVENIKELQEILKS